MTVKEAIRLADELRPNAISDTNKWAWIFEIEGKIARHMEETVPQNTWPRDSELLMPAPYESVYQLYLMCMIDLAQQDSALYADDMELFNGTYFDALAWWRRNNLPPDSGNWRVM